MTRDELRAWAALLAAVLVVLAWIGLAIVAGAARGGWAWWQGVTP